MLDMLELAIPLTMTPLSSNFGPVATPTELATGRGRQ